MKLRIGEKVFLQKYEIAFLLCETKDFPADILREAAEPGGVFRINSPMDCFRFDCKFENPANVEWLSAQDWILDYDEYVQMPLDELAACREDLQHEILSCQELFRSGQGNLETLYKLDHQDASIRGIIEFRKGRTEFVFPSEYDGPVSFSIFGNLVNRFRRLFSRGAQ